MSHSRILTSTHEPFVLFSLPYPAEQRSDKTALVGTQHPATVNSSQVICTSVPFGILTSPDLFYSNADATLGRINQNTKQSMEGEVQLLYMQSFTRKTVWVWMKSWDPSAISVPFCHRFITLKKVENTVIKLCDFCAASVTGSLWSVLWHLLHTVHLQQALSLTPVLLSLCSEHQGRGSTFGAAAQQNLLAPIYMLISMSFQVTATWQEFRK